MLETFLGKFHPMFKGLVPEGEGDRLLKGKGVGTNMSPVLTELDAEVMQ